MRTAIDLPDLQQPTQHRWADHLPLNAEKRRNLDLGVHGDWRAKSAVWATLSTVLPQVLVVALIRSPVRPPVPRSSYTLVA